MTNIAVYNKEQNQLIFQSLLPESRKFAVLNFEHKKIKDFNEGDYKNLYIYLVKLCEMSGITKPTNEALKSIVIFLKENYGNFSQIEVETSFSMAFAFKLDLEDVNNYGSLSVIWISKILNAYKIKRDKALVGYEVKKREIEFEKSQEKTQEEIDRYMSGAILNNFEKYKETKDFSDMGSSIFNTLNRFGFMKLNEEEKVSLIKRARQSILKRSQSEETGLKRIVSSLTKETPAEMERYEARDIAVVDLFDLWIKNNVNPKLLLKKYL